MSLKYKSPKRKHSISPKRHHSSKAHKMILKKSNRKLRRFGMTDNDRVALREISDKLMHLLASRSNAEKPHNPLHGDRVSILPNFYLIYDEIERLAYAQEDVHDKQEILDMLAKIFKSYQRTFELIIIRDPKTREEMLMRHRELSNAITFIVKNHMDTQFYRELVDLLNKMGERLAPFARHDHKTMKGRYLDDMGNSLPDEESDDEKKASSNVISSTVVPVDDFPAYDPSAFEAPYNPDDFGGYVEYDPEDPRWYS